MNEKISIVLPCYRAERTIEAMVNDIIAQTYRNWELICVSNGTGQEQQLAILNRLANANRGGQIKVFSEEKGNVSNARNVGMAHATGEWLAFVDADDRIKPNHLQLLMDAVADDYPDIVVAGFESHRCTDGIDHTAMTILTAGDGNEAKRDLTYDSNDTVYGVPWNKLLRMRFVRDSGVKFDEQYIYSEDVVFMCSLMLLTERLRTVPQCGYIYDSTAAFNSSSRWHACLEKVTKEKERMRSELMIQAGCSPEEVEQLLIDEQYCKMFLLVFKLFNDTCTLSFGEKVAAVKRMVFDNPRMKESMRRKVCNTPNPLLSIYSALYATRSPWVMTAAIHIMYVMKRLLGSAFTKIAPRLRRW